VVLGKLFKRVSGAQEEDQGESTAVRVLAGNRELSLGSGDTAAIVIRPVVLDNRAVEDRVVFQYTPAPHKLESGSAASSTVELGKPARESGVSVAHKGDHLLVAGKDFHIGTGSGVLHFEGGAAMISLEGEPSFSVEAAGYSAYFGVDWRSVQPPTGVPATRFTVELYRRIGQAVEKVAETQLGPGDMVVVERCSGAGCEEVYIISKTTTYALRLAQDMESLAKTNRENRKTAESEEVIYREPPATHLVLEVPREGGGIVVQDYAGHGKGNPTGGAVLVLEGVDGRPVKLALVKGTARFYPAPSKGLSIKLGTSALLHIEASH